MALRLPTGGLVTAATVTAAAAAWTALLTVVADEVLRQWDVFNGTDAMLEYSYDDGTTIHGYIPAGGGKAIDVYSNGIQFAVTTVKIRKYQAGANPTAGTFIVGSGMS